MFKKFLVPIVITIAVVSCSTSEEIDENQATDPDNVKETLGSIEGTIKLIDQFGIESFDYEGTTLKILKDEEILEQVVMDLDSIYSFPDFQVGQYTMVVEKEGYGSYDTLRINNREQVDKLSQIQLLEYPKVNANLVSVDYENGQIVRELLPCFESDKNFTIRYEYFFSKDPEVSFTKYDLRHHSWVTFWNTNLTRPCSQITIPARTGESYSIDNFIEAGFAIGDKIYVIIYPVHELFLGTVNNGWKDKNFEIIQHNRSNGSNIVEFIL